MVHAVHAMMMKDDDDSSAEGAIVRGLFGDDSSSSSENESQSTSIKNSIADMNSSQIYASNSSTNTTNSKCNSSSSEQRQPQRQPQLQDEADLNSPLAAAVVVSTVMGIPLAQRRGGTGCSIAQQLWQAAEHLAEFVQFQFEFQLDLENTSNRSTSTGRPISSSTDAIAATATAALGALIKTATTASPLQLLELGAGVGLTSLKIATLLPCHVLLTDLDEALPLMHQNIQLNAHNFICGPAAVQAQALRWGAATAQDCDEALAVLSQLDKETCKNDNTCAHNDTNTNTNTKTHMPVTHTPAQPILVLASDCVYFQQLHLPLEETFFKILSTAPAGSMCLVAGARRWKRDNAFYAKLGKATRNCSPTHHLVCTCLQETVTRHHDDNDDDDDDNNPTQQRSIMRIFAIQWVLKKKTRSAAGTS